jgi:hypothetical protein
LVIPGQQAAHLGDSKLSSVSISPVVSPPPVFRGVSAGGGHTGSSEGGASDGGADAGGADEGVRPEGPGANEGGTIPVRDEPAQVEAAAVDALPCADGIRLNKAEPRSEDASGGDTSTLGSSGGGGWLSHARGRCPL